MSELSVLEDHLQRYWQMDHHRKPLIASSLAAVQAWQKKRMQHTHAELFGKPEYQKLAEYFLNRLYGGDEFEVLARQLERILPKAKKIERIVPKSAIETGSLGIHLAILAVELDEAVAAYLLDHQLDVNDANMAATYCALNQEAARKEQMEMLSKLSYRIDKYVRAFLLQRAFDMAKGSAYKHGFAPLYDFIGEGFAAMKPIKSMPKFIDRFYQDELTIIAQVHGEVAEPFSILPDAS